MNQILELIFNPTNEKIIHTVLIFLILYMVLYLIKITIISSINKNAEKTKTQLDDLAKNIINSYGSLFYIFIPLYFTSQIVSITNTIDDYLYKFSIIFFAYYIVKTLTGIANFGFAYFMESQDKENKVDPALLKVVNSIVQIMLWIVATIIILQNFNFNLSALIGGLGITGIAVAFALQNVLKDIFAFFSILFDKPYKPKDFIVIDNSQMGTVKKISLRSTRLKTLQGEELIIPNQQMTDAQIRNYKQMKKRRVEFSIGVSYTTSDAKLKKIPKIVKKIVNSVDLCKFKYCRLKKLDQYSLIFEIIYHVDSPKYDLYMETREKINIEIIKKFKSNKINIPFPTQEIHMKK